MHIFVTVLSLTHTYLQLDVHDPLLKLAEFWRVVVVVEMW
jgi:hypothetical protein